MWKFKPTDLYFERRNYTFSQPIDRFTNLILRAPNRIRLKRSIMFLRFLLLILLIKNSKSVTNDELKEGNMKLYLLVTCIGCIWYRTHLTKQIELRLVRQDIGLLKVENKNQSDQITLLKGMAESQNKIINEKIVQELNKKMKNCAITDDESSSPEQKQLFRIIPSVHADAHTNNCRLLTTV